MSNELIDNKDIYDNGFAPATNKHNPKIMVKVKASYGRELIYPVDNGAQVFAKLCGQVTLGRREIDLIRQLGFDIEIEVPEALKKEKPMTPPPPRKFNINAADEDILDF